MNERSSLISRLKSDFKARAAYIQSKIGVLVPSQIRALRLDSAIPRQADLAKAAGMKQSRISMIETPGAANVTLATLSSIAAALGVGLVVKFVAFHEMLAWETSFSQDSFSVTRLDEDIAFLSPPTLPQNFLFPVEGRTYFAGLPAASAAGVAIKIAPDVFEESNQFTGLLPSVSQVYRQGLDAPALAVQSTIH